MLNGEIYEFAGIKVRITSLYEDVHLLCEKYRSEGTPKYEIETTAADVEYEQLKSDQEAEYEGAEPVKYSSGYLETLAVYRKIADCFLNDGVILFHGSAIAANGEAFIFTAKSGTGKSTHTKLWRKVYGDKVTMINDDKPLVRIREGKTEVFGTPWDGKHRLSANTSARLKAICIISRSPQNSIRKISADEAYAMLIQQTYRPRNAELMKKMLLLIDGLLKSVKFYALDCNMDDDAAVVSYEGMINDNS